tara:strand:+ start:1881 stop:2150 length:270 start_codon:yes stop_codon:yes gene_type:complete
MSTENIVKKNLKNTKFVSSGLKKITSDQKISNIELNKIYKNSLKKKKTKICINSLQEKLRKQKFKEKFVNRIMYGLFISFLAVLFFVST